jgi:hypothetical protein
VLNSRVEMCEGNLKQVGLAIRIWAGDHNDQYPFNLSRQAGGTMEFCDRDAEGFDKNAHLHYKAMSEELNTPRVLFCPDASSAPVVDFEGLTDSAGLYKLRTGSHVTGDNPNEVMVFCPIHKLVVTSDGKLVR